MWHMWEKVYKFWWENLKENYFGRPGHRWQDNNEMNLQGMGLEGNWMHVACVNTGGRLLWTQEWSFRFNNIGGISWLSNYYVFQNDSVLVGWLFASLLACFCACFLLVNLLVCRSKFKNDCGTKLVFCRSEHIQYQNVYLVVSVMVNGWRKFYGHGSEVWLVCQ